MRSVRERVAASWRGNRPPRRRYGQSDAHKRDINNTLQSGLSVTIISDFGRVSVHAGMIGCSVVSSAYAHMCRVVQLAVLTLLGALPGRRVGRFESVFLYPLCKLRCSTFTKSLAVAGRACSVSEQVTLSNTA